MLLQQLQHMPHVCMKKCFIKNNQNNGCTMHNGLHHCVISNDAEQLNKQTNKHNIMKTNTNERFTAAMLFNADKVLVQQLRDQHDLSEKEMMRVILNVASNNAELVAAEVTDIKMIAEAERNAVKNLRTMERENEKLAKQMQREQAKAEKLAAKAAEKAAREQARAEKMAAKAAEKAAADVADTAPAATTEPAAE